MPAAMSRRQAWLVGWLFVQAGVCGGALRAAGTSHELPWLVFFFATFLGFAALIDRVGGRARRAGDPRSDLVVVGIVGALMATPMAIAAVAGGRLTAGALGLGVPVAAVVAMGAAAVARYVRYPVAFWFGLALASGFVQVPSGESDVSWLAVLGCSAPGFAIAALSVWVGWGGAPAAGRWALAAAVVGATVALARVWTALALRLERDHEDVAGIVVFAGLVVFPVLAPALIERCLGGGPEVSDADG